MTPAPLTAEPARLNPRMLAAASTICLLVGILLAGILTGGRGVTAPAARAVPAAASGALAQSSLQDAIAAADHAYWPARTAGGFAASVPGSGVRALFARSAVSVSNSGVSVGMSLESVRSGAGARALGAVTPVARQNTVSYSHAGVSQWYADRPGGLEQGFTLQRPHGASSIVTLSLGLSTNADARLLAGAHGVVFSRNGSPDLYYRHLSVTDAAGRSLPSWLALRGGRLSISIDARDARYPLNVDPVFESEEKLTSKEGAELQFGYSVALSANGETALVGAPHAAGSTLVGWIFTRTKTVWALQATLNGAPEGDEPTETCDGSDSEAGECVIEHSVALSGNGEVALVGAPRTDEGSGAVLVFTDSASGWTQSTTLTAAEQGGAEHPRFGKSVAISQEGNTILVGGSTAHGGDGAAWIFRRAGGVWSQLGATVLQGQGEVGEGRFGYSVALNSAGTLGVVGSPGDLEGAGSATVISEDEGGTEWAPLTELKGDGALDARFGSSVAISGDSTTILVGARHDDASVPTAEEPEVSYAGAAYAFEHVSGTSWALQSKLTDPEEKASEGQFGYSVSLSQNGERAVIGAPHESGNAGAAWLFSRSGSTWTVGQVLRPDLESQVKTWFGASVALASEGSTALVGGSHALGGAGAVWAYTEEAAPVVKEPEPEPEPEPTPTTTPNTVVSPNLTGKTGVLSNQVVSPPVLAISGNIRNIKGTILVKLPHRNNVFEPVTGLRNIPFGSVVDALNGTVEVTTIGPEGKLQVSDFYGGYFSLHQSRSGLVTARLWGSSFAGCAVVRATRARAAAKAKHLSGKHVVRKLWAEGHGAYQTKGSYATGAVLGTRWLTEDECEGTLVYVATDKVLVTATRTHHHRTVTAGHSFLARAIGPR